MVYHQPGSSADFEGQVAMNGDSPNWLADVPPLTDIETEITGWLQDLTEIRLQGFDQLGRHNIEPLDLVFTQRLDHTGTLMCRSITWT